MTEIIIDGSATIVNGSLDEITGRIIELKQRTAQDAIELGKALLAAKAIVPHGQWSEYLKNRVDFSQRTASSLMKIAELFGDNSKWKSISNLEITKIYQLTKIPVEEQEDFLNFIQRENITTTREFEYWARVWSDFDFRIAELWRITDQLCQSGDIERLKYWDNILRKLYVQCNEVVEAARAKIEELEAQSASN